MWTDRWMWNKKAFQLGGSSQHHLPPCRQTPPIGRPLVGTTPVGRSPLLWTEWQTRVKNITFPQLRLWAVTSHTCARTTHRAVCRRPCPTWRSAALRPCPPRTCLLTSPWIPTSPLWRHTPLGPGSGCLLSQPGKSTLCNPDIKQEIITSNYRKV